MKKVFSILFTLLIFGSGMHFCIAAHICGGQVAAVKWSFSGDKATCGMEIPEGTSPYHNSITSYCCRYEVASYTVDNNYRPSDFQINDVIKKTSQVFATPVGLLSNSTISSISSYTNVSSPDKTITSNLSLAGICVFRI